MISLVGPMTSFFPRAFFTDQFKMWHSLVPEAAWAGWKCGPTSSCLMLVSLSLMSSRSSSVMATSSAWLLSCWPQSSWLQHTDRVHTFTSSGYFFSNNYRNGASSRQSYGQQKNLQVNDGPTLNSPPWPGNPSSAPSSWVPKCTNQKSAEDQKSLYLYSRRRFTTVASKGLK